ncbi:uncharacterized protein LOC117558858 isoform X3 [Gymnodraco acuticeps]|uniref:Uncharacterized protein LOC117558858 isoform X3 n=1 Tax=Gymnodraco acuticeps TaxID=8218 RepID=A0A6P8VKQ6_GYMAC|nr:uncharacterized protein LOC117558858 isoform X3 [Gymnodraco acuticeps]
MDSAAVCGENMKNVTELRGLKRVKCPDRREDIIVASRRSCRRTQSPECQRSARALEMFLKSLLTKICLITQSKNSCVVSVAHMKQCIESEKLFHFLIDMAERPSSAAQKDARGLTLWPMYSLPRSKMHEIQVQKPPEVVEMAPRRNLGSLDNDSSSSESELYICL